MVKAIYFYDDEIFNPLEMAGGESAMSAWRSSGQQIITLPHKILQAHSIHVSQRLAKVVAQVKDVETSLASADRTPPDLSAASRTLHICNADLIDLERRSRFEEHIIEAMESVVAKSRHGTTPWPALVPQQTTVSSRSFDFQSLPRRIENARATISSLNQQRNEQLNLELTEASFRIAETTLSDAKSMKTIAILTMLLLPGTAVASLFSMNMFNWSAQDGSHIESKWLWIYFVVAVPLTAMILVAWWIWTRQSGRGALRGVRVPEERTQSGFRDEEAGIGHSVSSATMEMHPTSRKEEVAG